MFKSELIKLFKSIVPLILICDLSASVIDKFSISIISFEYSPLTLKP